jgi:iron complex transport system substrate-binding protein
MRVVSLLPAATELLYAVGVEPVAVSHECDHPPAARNRPTVVSSRVENAGGSSNVNEQVADAAESGGVYEIDEQALRDADPDLVVTQGTCDVCAVDAGIVADAVERLGLDADVLTTHVHSLDGLFDDLRRVGDAVGRPDRAEQAVTDLCERVRAVADAAPDPADGPSVAVLDWLDPVMVAGHWVPEMVEMAGATYPLADPGDRSTPREWTEVRDADPDVLVAAPCGFTLDRILEHADDLTGRSGWRDLRAVRDDRAYAMDGHHLLNRPGPRLVDSLKYLAALLHPDRFDAPPDDVARSLAPVDAPTE